MSNQYVQENLAEELPQIFSKIFIENNRVSETIEKLVNWLDTDKKESAIDLTNTEFVSSAEVNSEFAITLRDTLNNIQNEVVFNSLMIIVASFVETCTTEICRFIHPYLKLNITPYYKYSQRKGLEKSKDYLKESLGLSITQLKGWNDLKKNTEIRNIIVHNDANIWVDYEQPLEKQPLYNFMQTNKNDIELTETGYIFIKDLKYIRQYHLICVDFLKELYQQILKIANEK